MPKAVANVSDATRFDLKTLEGAFVELRRMTYGQVVQRREMLKLSVTSAKGSKDFTGEMAMASTAITRFEFRTCIVNHNLEKDDNGTPFNFGSPVDFELLDPRVGQEIEKYIGEMNNFEDDEGN